MILNLTTDVVEESKYLQTKELALETAFLIKMVNNVWSAGFIFQDKKLLLKDAKLRLTGCDGNPQHATQSEVSIH